MAGIKTLGLRTLKDRHRRVLSEYAELKERVGEYNARRYLNPGEEMERRALQRVKLQKKDSLLTLAKEIEDIEASLDSSAVTARSTTTSDVGEA